MSDVEYPWRRPQDLETILIELKPVLVSLGVVERGLGCSESEIAAAEKRSRPFPDVVRRFYSANRPTELFAPGQRKEFGFYRIESDELTWKSMAGAEPAEDWASAHWPEKKRHH